MNKFNYIDRPFQKDYWVGRTDEQEGVRGQRWHQQVVAGDGSQLISLLGFCCDAGVARNKGRIGAAKGPIVLRNFFAGLPALSEVVLGDCGDVICTGDAMEDTQQRYAKTLTHLLNLGTTPLALGGGHEIAYGSFCGIFNYALAQQPKPKIAIINIDAHLDVRIDNPPSSGTPFRQMAEDCAAQGVDFNYYCLGVSRFANTLSLFDRAAQLGVTCVEDRQLLSMPFTQIDSMIDSFLADKDYVYITLDLDVLPAAVMPSVSAPAAFGVAIHIVEYVLLRIIASGKVKLIDIAEFNPTYDQDGNGARATARLMAAMIAALVEVKI